MSEVKEVTREELVQLIQSYFINEQIDVVATEHDVFNNPSNKEWVDTFLSDNNLKVKSNL